MIDAPPISQASTPVIAGLILAAAVATLALVGSLRRHQNASLRAKFIALFIGLAGAELALLPALLVAAFSESLGLRAGDWVGWLLAAAYAAFTLYVVARLFPWREVNEMAADPDAKLADILRRLRDGGR